MDEQGNHVLQETVANSRATLGMFGSGYIEMLARQMTVDLQAIRDTVGPGESALLETKGVNFGVLARDAEGYWDVSAVEGLPVLESSWCKPYIAPPIFCFYLSVHSIVASDLRLCSQAPGFAPFALVF